MFPRHSTAVRISLLLGDLVLTLGALLLANFTRYRLPLGLEPDLVYVTPGIVALVLVIWGVLFRFLGTGNETMIMILSSLMICGVWCLGGFLQHPVLVRASNDVSKSLTIYNASSTELTLKVMLIIAVLGMPVVIGYTIYTYYLFRGKQE